MGRGQRSPMSRSSLHSLTVILFCVKPSLPIKSYFSTQRPLLPTLDLHILRLLIHPSPTHQPFSSFIYPFPTGHQNPLPYVTSSAPYFWTSPLCPFLQPPYQAPFLLVQDSPTSRLCPSPLRGGWGQGVLYIPFSMSDLAQIKRCHGSFSTNLTVFY